MPGRTSAWPRVVVALVVAATLVACGGGGDVVVDDALARLSVAADIVDVRAGEQVAFRPGAVGEGLGGGDDVRTGQPGYAELAYRDGSLTRLDINAEFTVTDVAAEADAPTIRLELDVGRAWNRVADGADFEVSTDVGTAAVRGTAFDVDCRDPDNIGCVVTVVEGQVSVTGDAGDQVDLVAVQRVTVAPDGSLGEVEDLTLAQLRGDPWLGGNLAVDTARGFPALADATGPDTAGVDTAPVGYADVGVQDNEVDVVRDGRVRQRVVAGGPSEVALGWSFCNPQICGTSDNIVCVAGWNPTYRALQDVVVDPPAGYSLVRADIAVGATGAASRVAGVLTPQGWQGGTGGFAAAPTVSAGGGIRLALEAGGLEATYRRLPEFPDRPCAVSDERRDEILAEFGPVVEVGVAAVVIDVVWQRDTAAEDEPVEQVVQVGGAPQTITFQPAPSPPPLVTDAPVFVQDDEAWADTLAPATPSEAPPPTTPATPATPATDVPSEPPPPAFADVGTVPTILANAFVRLGHDVDPAVVASRLIDAGAWRPGVGASFAPFLRDGVVRFDALLDGAVQEATPTGIVDVLDDLAAGEAIVLAGLATPAARSMVLLTGYDAATDTLSVLHPRRGETTTTVRRLTTQLTTLHVMTPTPEVDG